jgi:F-type H+-transporting ATPase subunit epsilon/F-type H+-transporting ATPase subunit delta
MSEKFTIEIITPNKILLKSEAYEVIIPSYEGEMGILKDHIPLITFLKPGLIIIKDNEEKKYFIDEGTVEFVNNNLLILTSAAKNVESLENNFVEESIKSAEEHLKSSNISDKERYLISNKIDVLKDLRK